LIFVRDGVIAPAGADGQPLPDGRVLVATDWSLGDTLTVGGAEGTAPVQASCVGLFSEDLGDVQRLVAMGGEPPDTDLAWSPDGARLAVGSHTGEVLVLDGWTGTVLARKRLAETMVKHVVWSLDGATLDAAEQSPDANVMALDPQTLAARWTLRLADIVETTAPPSGEDIYGIFQLPAAYGLQVLDSGDLLLSALHSWRDASGTARNRSQVLRLTPDGTIAARWPEQPADATLKHPRVSGDRVAVIVSRSADGPPPADLPLGGVQVLTLPDLTPLMSATTPALEPWFRKANIWAAMDVQAEPGRLMMGFGDGRVRVVADDGSDTLSTSTGAPIMAGDVPIHASIGWGLLHDGRAIFTTSGTNIPWGAASPETRPPSVHPGANRLWVHQQDGGLDWVFSDDHALQGASLAEDGRHLIVGAGDRSTDHRRDLYGALIFDLQADEDSAGPLRAFCPTAGPVSSRHAMSRDGRVAVAEHPYLDEDGALKGAYRVTVLR
jgi:hypothetical protein